MDDRPAGMSRGRGRAPRRRFRWVAALALGAAGLLLNLAPVSMSPGTDLLFGGVAALLAAAAFGAGPGLLAASIASVQTVWLWRHPYAWVIFSLEGLIVGWLVQRWRVRPLVADLLYWLFLGVPLLGFTYTRLLGMGGSAVVLVVSSDIAPVPV